MGRPGEVERVDEPPLHEWASWLEAVRDAETLEIADWVVVVAETDSTQDIARRLAGKRGSVVVIAGRQVAGRGRLGRRWADTRDAGLAMSFALRPPEAASGSISMIAALAACEAVERAVSSPGNPLALESCEIAIRWPNDIVTRRVAPPSRLFRRADEARVWCRDALAGSAGAGRCCPIDPPLLAGRKLAGILIERAEGVTIVGIGVNVGQASLDWPPELRDSAASLRQLGSDWSRLDVAESLMAALDRWLRRSATEVLDAYRGRDCMVGATQTFSHAGERYRGIVEAIDPTGAIRVRLPSGETVELPAATTSLVQG